MHIRDRLQLLYLGQPKFDETIDLAIQEIDRLAMLNGKLALDTAKGCSVCGETPVVNIPDETYWLCGGCVAERMNDVAAFQAIRAARCQLEDDGNDNRFIERVDEALEEHGLSPEPCPMCNRYGEHVHHME